MGQFDGKVAYVTGAASGVGRATVRRFAAEGARVHGVDINADGLAETAAAHGDSVTTEVVDITDRDAVHASMDGVAAALGRVDVVANVAGAIRMGHMTDVSQADFDLMMRVNVEGMFWVTQAAIPHLLETGGNVVNVASNAGLMGQAYSVVYCASKGAVVNMTRAMAMEYVKTNVRINAVAPGGMDTGMTDDISLPEDMDFALMQPYMGFRGMAAPDTCANAIAWLASEQADRCTGTILSIDGGLAAG